MCLLLKPFNVTHTNMSFQTLDWVKLQIHTLAWYLVC